MGDTLKYASPAPRSGAADNQQSTELMTYLPPFKANLWHTAGPISGSGSSDMNSMMPRHRCTTTYGATKHGMNNARAEERREHRQTTREGDGIMIVQDEAHTTNKLDDGADMPHILRVLLSSGQHDKATTGIFPPRCGSALILPAATTMKLIGHD